MGKKRDTHSKAPTEGSHQKPSAYDYTQGQNIQDAQKNYDNEIAKKRGLPGSERYSPSENEHTKTVEVAHNRNIEAAQREFEETVAAQRGITRPLDNACTTETGRSYGLIGGGYDSNEKQVYVSSINRYRGVEGDIQENRSIDMSELYEKSARGGEASSEFAKNFGASQDDITHLLDTRDIRSSRGIKFKVSDTMGGAVSTISHYLYSTSTSGTDFGQGIRQINMITAPVVFIATDRILMSAKKTLLKDMYNRLVMLEKKHNVFGRADFLGAPELGLNGWEIKRLQEELEAKLKKSGLKGLSHRGVVSYNQISKFLRQNKGKLLESEVGALLMLKELKRYEILNQKTLVGRRRMRGSIRTRLFRYMQQNEAGQGLVYTYNFYKRGYQTLKMGLKSVRMTAAALGLTGKVALKVATKAAAAAAKTKLGERIAMSKMGQKTSAGIKKTKGKTQKVRTGLDNAKKRFKDTRLGRFGERTRSFIRDPFGLKRRRGEFLKYLGNTKLGRAVNKILSPYKMLKQILARLLAGLMAVVSALISIVLVIIAILIVVVIVVIVIISLFMAVMNMFDLSTSEEKIIKDGLVYIKELSEDQNKQLQQMGGRYRNMNITYKSEKNEDAYNDPDNQPDRPVVETTNSAEIMSMAQVYFDFDLESVKMDKIKDYIKKLYYGSHLIEVIEHPVYTTDEDGNTKLAYTNADVNYITYYFDAIFDAKLTSGGVGILQTGTIAAGTEIEIPNSFSQSITVTLYDQWVYEWGVAPGTGQRQVSEVWKAQGGKFDNGIAYIEVGGQKRYLIAMTSTYGVCGDYVDVYLSNGSVLPCIIADAKNPSDHNYTQWGHESSPGVMNIIEMEVAQSYYYQYGNPGKPSWWPELANPVTKVVNGGSMFAYPDGPIGPVEPEDSDAEADDGKDSETEKKDKE